METNLATQKFKKIPRLDQNFSEISKQNKITINSFHYKIKSFIVIILLYMNPYTLQFSTK